MKKNVNLFDPTLSPKLLEAGPWLMPVGALLIAALVWGWAVWGQRGVQQLTRQVAQEELEIKSLEAKQQQLQGQVGQASPDELEKAFESEKIRLQRLLGAVNHMGGADLAPADFLEALAQAKVMGLWLTHIKVLAQGQVQLQGQTHDMQQMAQLLAKLKEGELFQGWVVSDVESERLPGAIKFRFKLSRNGFAPEQPEQSAANKALGKSKSLVESFSEAAGAPPNLGLEGKPNE